MLDVKLTFNIDNQGILKQMQNKGTAIENVLAKQVKKDTEPYVPYAEGTLTNRTYVDGNLIVYPGPYARFLYYGKLMVSPTTGSAWALKGEKKVLTDKDLRYNTAVHKFAQSHWFEASKAENLDKWIKLAQKTANGG